MQSIIKLLIALLTLVPIGIRNDLSKVHFYPKKEEIKSYEVVHVTMYTIDPKQTDDSPTETASGFVVDSLNPKKHRIIAVSRDLKRKLKWGQKVRVTGIGSWSGVYYVRDLMNKRFVKRIDILINPEERAISFKKAKIYYM